MFFRSFLVLSFALGIAAGLSRASDAGETRVRNESGKPVDLSSLEVLARDALERYERSFGPAVLPLELVYGASDCLDTRYDFEKKIVRLCESKKVRNAGLDSTDVLRHEIFHALFCGTHPRFCTVESLQSPDAVATHEALADYFAYQAEPDDAFGENYLLAASSLRSYRNTLCYSLAAGSHAKGSALVGEILREGRRLGEIAEVLESASDLRPELLVRTKEDVVPLCFLSEDEAPRIRSIPRNYPASKLNRYRLEMDRPLELQFTTNLAFERLSPELRIEWTREDGSAPRYSRIEPTATTPNGFLITVNGEEAEKLIATFYTGANRIGQSAFYFGKALKDGAQ